jgi:nucleoside-diphosphate-sugar epimerase
MTRPTAFVTGASGFVGSAVVRRLSAAGYNVVAGVHRQNGAAPFAGRPNVRTLAVDILDPAGLREVMTGADQVYHFAALMDSHRSRRELESVNAVGTRNVWEAAASCGVRRALYCSSAAVYGLLAGSCAAIGEDVRPRAVEPYGSSKRRGEEEALAVAARTGLHTTIIRPVAIFGPGERSPFGRQLRIAALSKLLLAGGFEDRGFNFVHVEDVAAAAVYLMLSSHRSGEAFNVAVNDPIRFEDAFQAYRHALARAGRPYLRVRMLALCSSALHRLPSMPRWAVHILENRLAFRIWHPGFDLTYSSAKLCAGGFAFEWTRFEDIFSSCLDPERDTNHPI